MLVIIWLALFTPCFGMLERACNIKGWMDYSGYRVQREFSWSRKLATRHQMVITRCSFGEIMKEWTFEVDPDEDIAWNTTICNETCIRLARRAVYTSRDLSLYAPTQLVGAVFSCENNGTEVQEQDCQPVLPLLADWVVKQWTQVSDKKPVVRVPILYTPDVLDRAYPASDVWKTNVNPFEHYHHHHPPVLLKKLLLGNGDYSQFSRVLADYSPAQFTHFARHIQALVDQW